MRAGSSPSNPPVSSETRLTSRSVSLIRYRDHSSPVTFKLFYHTILVIKQLCLFRSMISDTIKFLDLAKLSTTARDNYCLHRDISFAIPATLLSSIHRFGIFQPPVVIKEGDTYLLICGFRRIEALKQVGAVSPVACKVIHPPDPLDLLAVILEDQLLAGPLSVIMTARFITLLESLIVKEERSSVLKELKFGPYEHLKRFTPLLDLEVPIRDALHRGTIADSVGLSFCSMPTKDRLFLSELFENLALNKNKQKRLLEFCQIIVAQHGGSIKELFTETFPDILTPNSDANIPQMTGFLLGELYRLSHPLSAQAESSFNRWRNTLRMPNNCEMTHSQSFETDRVTLSIDFKNREEASMVWSEIKNLLP